MAMFAIRVLLFTLLMPLSSADVQDVAVEQCAETCQYNDTDSLLDMNCNDRGCTSTPDIKEKTEHWWDKSYIKSLLLKDNTIHNLTKFNKYEYLETIDLTNCQIETIETGAFEQCSSLKVLILTNNKLGTIQQDHFRELYNLQQLYLNGNKLNAVTDNVFINNLRNVLKLDLSDNAIKDISPNAFTDIQELQFLHLERNLLYRIDAKDFLGLPKLLSLYLRENQLSRIPKSAFVDLENLEVLDIRKNRIKYLEPDSFIGLKKLKILHLTRNLIGNISNGVLMPMSDLEDIYLGDNPIKTIMPGNFPTSLKKISMQNMRNLEIIHNGTFTALWSVQKLELIHSKKFMLFDVGAFNMQNSSVTVLNLYNNSLQSIHENLFNWSAITTMNLGRNRWYCDCDLAWAKHSQSIPKEVKETMICYGPYHLSGKSVSEVDFTQFSCAYYDTHRGSIEVAVIFFITVLFAAAACLLMYKFRHTVFPCIYNTPGKYSSMYNAVNTEEEEAVEIKWKNDKQAETVIPGPTSV